VPSEATRPARERIHLRLELPAGWAFGAPAPASDEDESRGRVVVDLLDSDPEEV
jgi:hypothetical protein